MAPCPVYCTCTCTPLHPLPCNRYPLILTQPVIRNVYRVTGPFLTHLLAGWQNFSDESISIASSNVLPSLSSQRSTSLPQFRVQDSWTGPTTWKISLGIISSCQKFPRRETFEIPANFNISRISDVSNEIVTMFSMSFRILILKLAIFRQACRDWGAKIRGLIHSWPKHDRKFRKYFVNCSCQKLYEKLFEIRANFNISNSRYPNIESFERNRGDSQSFFWIFWNLREFWFSGSQRFDKILGRKKPRGISCQKCLDEKLESFVEFSTTNEHSWYIFWESFDFRELGQRVRSKFLFCRFLLTRSVPATDLPSNTMAIIPLIKSIDRRIV